MSIAFIDLSEQLGAYDDGGSPFAFYDLGNDQFFMFSDKHVWDTKQEFVNSYKGKNIEVFLAVMPDHCK